MHEGLAEPSKDDVLAKVEDVLQSNNMHYEYYWSPSRGCVVVDIDRGDWKHDHLRLEWLMEENDFRQIGEVTTEEDGSDCYSAIHTFIYLGDEY